MVDGDSDADAEVLGVVEALAPVDADIVALDETLGVSDTDADPLELMDGEGEGEALAA